MITIEKVDKGMIYLKYGQNLEDVYRHLRNKNMALFYARTNFIKKCLHYLLSAIAKIRMSKFFLSGSKLVVSEQIVENPLILRNLRDKDKTILDFGGFESILPLQLSAIGYKVTVWDQRPYPFCHPNLTVLCTDMLSGILKINERFDVVLSISTIEHLGLSHYGDITEAEADKTAVNKLWSLVKEGGRLMITVPAGKPAVQRGYRIYNQETLANVFPNISKIYWFAKEGREGIWREVAGQDITNLNYSEPYSAMPTEACCLVICDKGK